MVNINTSSDSSCSLIKNVAIAQTACTNSVSVESSRQPSLQQKLEMLVDCRTQSEQVGGGGLNGAKTNWRISRTNIETSVLELILEAFYTTWVAFKVKFSK